MKRRLVYLTCLALMLFSLASCKKEAVITSIQGGVLYVGDKAQQVKEWRGSSLYHEDDIATYEVVFCDSDLEDCVHNSAGVKSENLSKYEGLDYYTAFLGRECHMFRKGNGHKYELFAVLKEGVDANEDLLVQRCYNILQAAELQDFVEYVVYENLFRVKTADLPVKARSTEFVIPGVIRIGKNIKLPSGKGVQFPIGTLTAMKYSGEYDYYVISGVTIQVNKGTDVSTLIMPME